MIKITCYRSKWVNDENNINNHFEGRIPKRWDNYSNFGEIIEGIFLPFKTPLSKELFEESSYTNEFNPASVLEKKPRRIINLSGK